MSENTKQLPIFARSSRSAVFFWFVYMAHGQAQFYVAFTDKQVSYLFYYQIYRMHGNNSQLINSLHNEIFSIVIVRKLFNFFQCLVRLDKYVQKYDNILIVFYVENNLLRCICKRV